MLHFNKTRLQRVIDNTLSNAIKYSYDNAAVTVTLHETKAGLVMAFQDEGVGIEFPEKIFERYYRENEEKGGFGIGLNIVKNIIDDAGILMEVRSKPKNGTTFLYTFPPGMYFVID
jgi:signal transduction histidine kinase